jgi:predicted metal-dependent peptidase
MAEVHNPSGLPEPTLIDHIEEPYIRASVITAADYIGPIMTLCLGKRGELVKQEYISGNRMEIIFDMPLGEIVIDLPELDGMLREIKDEPSSCSAEEGDSEETDGGSGGAEGDLKQEWQGRAASAASGVASMGDNSKGYDDVPDFVKRMIDKMKEPTIDWKKILNNFVQERICDYSFAPPDRRFSDSEFFLPDFNEKDFVSKEVLFMVDTSGSVEDEDLAIVYSEIRGAIEQFGGKLMGKLGFFDADVTPPLPFENVGDLMSIIPYGGGGTDFTVIFDYIHNNCKDELPACIVIFTDGDGLYPSESDAMGIPVLWIINNFDITPPWGTTTRIIPVSAGYRHNQKSR